MPAMNGRGCAICHCERPVEVGADCLWVCKPCSQQLGINAANAVQVMWGHVVWGCLAESLGISLVAFSAAVREALRAHPTSSDRAVLDVDARLGLPAGSTDAAYQSIFGKGLQ